MVKRIVDTDFWTSRQVIDKYSVEDKYFALYLMTNGRSTQVGIYSLPKKVMSFETGFTTDVIQVLIDRFSNKYGEIIYCDQTQEVTLLNSLSYSILTGGAPVKRLLQGELRDVEEGSLILDTYYAMLDFWNGSVRKFDKEIKSVFEKEIAARGLVGHHSQNDKHNDNHSHSHSHIHNDNHNHKTVSKTLMTQRVNQDVTHTEIKNADETNQEEVNRIEQYIKYLKHKKPTFTGVVEESEVLCIFYKELLGEVTLEVQEKFNEWESKLPKSIILEALVRSEEKFKPISYADTIISNWLDQGVKNTKDIAQLDRVYSREKLED